jgi:hypothetical protein
MFVDVIRKGVGSSAVAEGTRAEFGGELCREGNLAATVTAIERLVGRAGCEDQAYAGYGHCRNQKFLHVFVD